MYKIDEKLYKNIADQLYEHICDQEYYSGEIIIEHEQTRCHFISSLIICHTSVSQPEGESLALHNIIPVWWEVHLFTEEGKQITDFDFETLKSHIYLC